MALPRPERIALARLLYHQEELGRSRAQAEAYARAHLGGAVSPADLRSAWNQIDRGLSAEAFLATVVPQATFARGPGGAWQFGVEGTAEPDVRLRRALSGERAPAPQVGVRVNLVITQPSGRLILPTVYLPMTWDSTVEDLVAAAADAAQAMIDQGSGDVYHGFRLAGPVRWPAPVQY